PTVYAERNRIGASARVALRTELRDDAPPTRTRRVDGRDDRNDDRDHRSERYVHARSLRAREPLLDGDRGRIEVEPRDQTTPARQRIVPRRRQSGHSRCDLEKSIDAERRRIRRNETPSDDRR